MFLYLSPVITQLEAKTRRNRCLTSVLLLGKIRALLGQGQIKAEIAQLVEHAAENRGVASSILALGTPSQIPIGYAGVVQLVERLLAKEKVVGSSPIARSETDC